MTATPVRLIHDGLFNYFCEFDAEALIGSFHLHGQPPEPGVIRNFLDTRIPPSVFPQVLNNLAGSVEGRPWPGNWHAVIAEWAAALRTVEQAQATGQQSYRISSLRVGGRRRSAPPSRPCSATNRKSASTGARCGPIRD